MGHKVYSLFICYHRGLPLVHETLNITGFYAPKQSIILLNIFISLKQTRNKLVVGITIVKKKETNNIREY